MRWGVRGCWGIVVFRAVSDRGFYTDREWVVLVSGYSDALVLDVDVSVVRNEGCPKKLCVAGVAVDEGGKKA